MNALLVDADDRHLWSSLFDTRGATVAEFTTPLQLTGLALERADGGTVLRYLSAVVEAD